MNVGLKGELRVEYLRKREGLSESEIHRLDADLLNEFKNIPLKDFQFIHFFIPIEKFREPNTLPIIHWILKEHPEIKIVLSRCNVETNLMEHFIWDGQELLESRWGIKEPHSGTRVLSQQLDAVIVPLLAFDKEGNRVGFGKGFYDRFLSDCREDCKKIGLSFFDPVDKINDIDSLDVRLDLCITNSKTWRFNKQF
jgi:5-formyltetrahydrofolate cyclo-ligase